MAKTSCQIPESSDYYEFGRTRSPTFVYSRMTGGSEFGRFDGALWILSYIKPRTDENGPEDSPLLSYNASW
jgi:hypothetical protein